MVRALIPSAEMAAAARRTPPGSKPRSSMDEGHQFPALIACAAACNDFSAGANRTLDTIRPTGCKRRRLSILQCGSNAGTTLPTVHITASDDKFRDGFGYKPNGLSALSTSDQSLLRFP